MKIYKLSPLRLNHLFGLIVLPMLAVACQAPSDDLYQKESVEMSAQRDDVSFSGEVPDDVDLGLDSPSSLPSVGDVQRPEVNAPGGVRPPQEASLINVTQTLSLRRNPQKPMLDLVFVMDDSNSMEPHQTKLAREMTTFTRELSKLDLLDYRIGVVPIYDSRRYFKKGEPGEDRYEQGVREWGQETASASYTRNFYRLGRLVHLKDAKSDALLNERFATPQTLLPNLEATLRLGAQVFHKYDLYNYLNSEGQIVAREQDRMKGTQFSRNDLDSLTEILVRPAKGPLTEEILAPMVAALSVQSLLFGQAADHYRAQYPTTHPRDPEIWNAPSPGSANADERWMQFAKRHNNNFVREKAHLGVIFVTDVIDRSVGQGAREAAEALRQIKGDDGTYNKISTFGVLHKNTVSYALQNKFSREWRLRHCNGSERVDDEVRGKNGWDQPPSLEQFLNLTRGDRDEGSNILNLCSENYGENLVRIARELFKKSVQRGEYNLERVPTAGSLRVVFKDDLSRVVPTCRRGVEQGLCWSLQIRPGTRKLILESQEELELQELLVTYQTLDPRTATQLNSGR